ncbi:MAG: LysE family translocator [Desulfobacterales bacterium]|nr:LysE family translocator [Desulfobacterales bacterium]
MSFEMWLTFSSIALLNIISPGPAILLAISNGVTSGPKAVSASSAGNVLGLLFVSSVSLFGVGAILQASAFLFMLLKMAGGSYLIYLGIRKYKNKEGFLTAGHKSSSTEDIASLSKFKEGFLIAATNPKAILFFVAFFPLFLNVDAPVFPQFIIMTLTFMILSFISLMAYGYLAKTARRWLADIRMVRVFHKVTGGIFIGMGLFLLQVKRNQT